MYLSQNMEIDVLKIIDEAYLQFNMDNQNRIKYMDSEIVDDINDEIIPVFKIYWDKLFEDNDKLIKFLISKINEIGLKYYGLFKAPFQGNVRYNLYFVKDISWKHCFGVRDNDSINAFDIFVNDKGDLKINKWGYEIGLSELDGDILFQIFSKDLIFNHNEWVKE